MPDDGNHTTPDEQTSWERQPHDRSTTPKDLRVQLKDQRLTIEWNDGIRSEYSLDELRKRCPCATCRTNREQQQGNPLQILKTDPTGIHVTHAQLVGNYAIRFSWSDGHDSGIFDFRLLRSFDQR